MLKRQFSFLNFSFKAHAFDQIITAVFIALEKQCAIRQVGRDIEIIQNLNALTVMKFIQHPSSQRRAVFGAQKANLNRPLETNLQLVGALNTFIIRIAGIASDTDKSIEALDQLRPRFAPRRRDGSERHLKEAR